LINFTLHLNQMKKSTLHTIIDCLLVISTVLLIMTLLFSKEAKAFDAPTVQAQSVYSTYMELSDLIMLKQMWYPVSRMEAYGLYFDLDSACINYLGTDYNLKTCLNKARIEVQG
jgi:hypothetical protein